VPDEVYEQVRPFFSEKELGDLTFAVATINLWNRLNIAARTEPGTYQPGKTIVRLTGETLSDARSERRHQDHY
jgi:hypothetical protein